MPAKSASHKQVRHHQAHEEPADRQPAAVEPPSVPSPIVILDSSQQPADGRDQSIDIHQTTPPRPSSTASPSAPESTTDQQQVPAIDPVTITSDPVVPDMTPKQTVPETPPVQDDGFIPESGGNGKKLIFVFIIALLIGGGAVAGFFYVANPYKPTTSPESPAQTATSETTSPTPIATERETATSSATQTPADLSSFKMQILNGSGTAGEAGVVRDLLKTEGFTQFEVGNADTYDFTTTEVHLVPTVPNDVFEKIKKSLTAYGYTVDEKDVLPESSSYHVVIMVGTR